MLLTGILIGWLLFSGGSDEKADMHDHSTEFAKEATWTCSMHPQIRQNEPGDCPICGMDLIPVGDDSGERDAMAIRMSETAMQLANVRTAIVGKKEPVKEIRLNGKVETDERLLFTQSSHIPGRIEKLMVNFTGDYVTEGQVIANMYSPELVTAQEELFEAWKIKKTQPELFAAAVEKLKNWKLSEAQINNILNSGKPRDSFPVLADVSGYVTQKMVNSGDYIRKGKGLYRIADLSSVWVFFDVYESDLPWIRRGNNITFTIAALPGKNFSGVIDYIDPVIDPGTRVAKARVSVKNNNQLLKPQMFASGLVKATLTDRGEALIVPKTAVMWTGERSLVYVKQTSADAVHFLMREVTLGPALGDSYIIAQGLEAEEEIAVHGTFSIDAAAQLAGKPSMMNPEGGVSMTGHDHGGQGAMQEMPGSAPRENVPISEKAQYVLEPLYNNYFDLKNHLVNDNFGRAVQAGKELRRTLGQVDMGLFKGEAQNIWMNNAAKLSNGLEHVHHYQTIEELRKAFQDISDAMIIMAQAFRPGSETIYVQHCPMADSNKGADWLSKEKDIRNPYYGASMLTCGEVTSTIE